jgi:hypothetical protein
VMQGVVGSLRGSLRTSHSDWLRVLYAHGYKALPYTCSSPKVRG